MAWRDRSISSLPGGLLTAVGLLQLPGTAYVLFKQSLLPPWTVELELEAPRPIAPLSSAAAYFNQTSSNQQLRIVTYAEERYVIIFGPYTDFRPQRAKLLSLGAHR